MKTLTKRAITLILVIAYALTLFTFADVFATGSKQRATAAESNAEEYFYNNLKDDQGQNYVLAKKFYDALNEMRKSGDFEDGQISYSLTEKGVLTSAEIEKWVVNGDITVPKAFSVARDAFLTDHPEVFYVDFYKMTISAARSNGTYAAYIDSGREANVFYDKGFTSGNEVKEAIKQFDASVDKIVKAANAAAQSDTYQTDKNLVKARYVNKYLAENVSYDYGAYDEYLQTGSSASSAASINTAYGALIVKKAVCAGFARAYKVVMDKLGIPCLVVNGYSIARDNGKLTERSVAHAWNYIWLDNPATESAQASKVRAVAYAAGNDGAWYAVDTTWNNGNLDKNKYMALGSVSINKDHIVDGVISSSNYELVYPELSAEDYGSISAVPGSGLVHSVVYEEESGDLKDDFGQPLMIAWETISYNGKGVVRLYEEDGLRLAYRRAYLNDDGQTEWTLWTDAYTMIKKFEESSGIRDSGTSSTFYVNTNGLYIQFAVMDVAPDKAWDLDATVLCYYSDESEPGDHMTAVSKVFVNQAHGTYTPAPYVKSTTPNHASTNIISDGMADQNSDTVIMAESNVKTYSVTYDEKLHVLDPSKPIGISWTSEHANASQYAKLWQFEDGSYVKLVNDDTLQFRFAPSLMWEHNGEGYIFSFTNVGSTKKVSKITANGTQLVTSDKLPNPVYFDFARVAIACPNIFKDGRLWVDICAQPTLVSNSDLSEMDFRDEDGNSTFSEQERSQMMLVVNNVNSATETDMLNKIDEEFGVKESDIKASETYDINLQICGKYPKIPDGSYVKLALGFPEGYGPDDEGVTFKIYHRKHVSGNNYVIEEVPCVVTKFGIVVTCTSFSPYMVAVVDADKASSDKTIFACIDGKGGKLTKEDGKIKSVKQGESCVYTVKPDEGYQIFSVTLNGKDVTADVKNNQLSLTYDELSANNELEIKYIANGAVKRVVDNGIVSPAKVVVNGDKVEKVSNMIETPTYLDTNVSNTGAQANSHALTIGIIVGVAVVLVALVVAALVLCRKNAKAK